MIAAFSRLEQLGFTPSQLRNGALELLHEEEWASQPAAAKAETAQAAAEPPPQSAAQADSAPSIH